jgi:hypothetical protein
MDQIVQVQFVHGLNYVAGINGEEISDDDILYDGNTGTEIGTVNDLKTRPPNGPGRPSRVIDANGTDYGPANSTNTSVYFNDGPLLK